MNLIAQGAEAVLYKDHNLIIKERLAKPYRVPEIDLSLRRSRTKKEVKVLEQLQQIHFPAPRVIHSSPMSITMDFIAGEQIKQVLSTAKDYLTLAREIGWNIALLHSHNIIHGDLTTSNMILHQKNVYFIDFGLSFISDKIEDKAVDLFLLDRALQTKHYQLYPDVFVHVLEGYQEKYTDAPQVLQRLEQVKGRGRNKK